MATIEIEEDWETGVLSEAITPGEGFDIEAEPEEITRWKRVLGEWRQVQDELRQRISDLHKADRDARKAAELAAESTPGSVYGYMKAPTGEGR